MSRPWPLLPGDCSSARATARHEDASVESHGKRKLLRHVPSGFVRRRWPRGTRADTSPREAVGGDPSQRRATAGGLASCGARSGAQGYAPAPPANACRA
jgi:hypothetical protein